MAHDDTFQPDPDRTDTRLPAGGALRSDDDRHESVDGPDLVDRSPGHGADASPQGSAGVVLGVAGLPDRDSLQAAGDTGASDLGAAIQRPTGLGATRGDERAFAKTPAQITDVGGTRGTGAGTGRIEGAGDKT
jgi:hypothetical protein